MILKGKTIYLRPITINDATETYVDWLNDKTVNQFLESRFVLATIENVKKFIEHSLQSPTTYFFAIIDTEAETHIGNIKLGPVNTYHKRGDIGILIGNKQFWGKGTATQAIALVTQFAFQQLNLNKVSAGCYANNTASYKAFIKCGYKEEGLLKKHCLTTYTEWVDVNLLACYQQSES